MKSHLSMQQSLEDVSAIARADVLTFLHGGVSPWTRRVYGSDHRRFLLHWLATFACRVHNGEALPSLASW